MTTTERVDEPPRTHKFEDDAALRYFVRVHEDYVFMIGLQARPGVTLCSAAIEHLVYPPGTEANRRFEVLLNEWQGMLFYTIGVPREDKHLWRPLVRATMLRPADGVPATTTPTGWALFPVDFDHCRHLEFTRDHPIQRNPRLFTQLADVELGLCNRLFAGWKPDAAELRRAWVEGIAGAGSFVPHP